MGMNIIIIENLKNISRIEYNSYKALLNFLLY